MVWPFIKREDNSPDSFERTLSKIADQIKSTGEKLAVLRQRARRYNGLLIFYGILGYLLYLVVLLLLYGYQNITPAQGGGLFGGPLGIYIVKKMINEYYARRIKNAEERLIKLQKEQSATIDRLKAATKYSTTQSLIEKYGGTAGIDTQEAEKLKKQTPKKLQAPQYSRPGRSSQMSPQMQHQLQQQQIQQRIVQQQLMAQQGGFPPPGVPIPPGQRPPQPQPLHMQGHMHSPSIHHLQPEEASAPRWYDRIMDMILGEDETSAKNRYALICHKCRMVNGLAPPGTLNPDDVDQWGCARCGTMNGRRREGLSVPRPSSAMSQASTTQGAITREPTPAPPESNSTGGSESMEDTSSDVKDGASEDGEKVSNLKSENQA